MPMAPRRRPRGACRPVALLLLLAAAAHGVRVASGARFGAAVDEKGQPDGDGHGGLPDWEGSLPGAADESGGHGTHSGDRENLDDSGLEGGIGGAHSGESENLDHTRLEGGIGGAHSGDSENLDDFGLEGGIGGARSGDTENLDDSGLEGGMGGAAEQPPAAEGAPAGVDQRSEGASTTAMVLSHDSATLGCRPGRPRVEVHLDVDIQSTRKPSVSTTTIEVTLDGRMHIGPGPGITTETPSGDAGIVATTTIQEAFTTTEAPATTNSPAAVLPPAVPLQSTTAAPNAGAGVPTEARAEAPVTTTPLALARGAPHGPAAGAPATTTLGSLPQAETARAAPHNASVGGPSLTADAPSTTATVGLPALGTTGAAHPEEEPRTSITTDFTPATPATTPPAAPPSATTSVPSTTTAATNSGAAAASGGGDPALTVAPTSVTPAAQAASTLPAKKPGDGADTAAATLRPLLPDNGTNASLGLAPPLAVAMFVGGVAVGDLPGLPCALNPAPRVSHWLLSPYDDVWLQAGWLSIFLGAVGKAAVLRWLRTRHTVKDKEEDLAVADAAGDAPSEGGPGVGGGLAAWGFYALYWGTGPASVCADLFTVLLAVANFLLFTLATEALCEAGAALGPYNLAEPGAWAVRWHDRFEVGSLAVLLLTLVCRAWGAKAHPLWSPYGCAAGFHYLMRSPFAYCDCAAIALSAADFLWCRPVHTNFAWLSVARGLDMLGRRGLGIRFRGFGHLLKDELGMLFSAFALGGVLWVLASGLYFVLNNDNPLAAWPAAVDAATGEPWERFQSVPAAMFFVLINLCKKNPLAAVFATPAERALVVFVNSLFVPLFALPTGLLGSMLARVALESAGSGSALPALQAAAAATGSPTLAPPAMLAAGSSPSAAPSGGGGGAAAAAAPAASSGSAGDDGAAGRGAADPVFASWVVPDNPEVVARGATLKEDEDEMSEAAICDVGVALGLASVAAYCLSTGGVLLPGHRAHFPPTGLAVLDGLSGLVFVREWLMRLMYSGRRYPLSPMAAVDFLSAWPGVIHLSLVIYSALPGRHWHLEGAFAEWMRAACVMRVFKVERFMHVFADMYDVWLAHRPVLATTGFVTCLLWAAASVALYLSERLNPDAAVRANYGSVARALWVEAMMVTGEWVLVDFTPIGKAICTVVALFSVSVCVVPLMVFSGGFFAKMLGDFTQLQFECQERQKDPWQLACEPQGGCRRDIFRLFYEHMLMDRGRRLPRDYRLVRAVSMLLCVSGCLVTVVVTNKTEACIDNGHCLAAHWRWYFVDAGFALAYTLEMFLRCLALGVSSHLTSAIGVCDVLSLAAWCFCLSPLRMEALGLDEGAQAHAYFQLAVPLRLVRLFCMDSYFDTLRVFKSILSVTWNRLLRSGFALGAVWLLQSTLMHLLEREGKQRERYASIVSSLQYSLVHLTGDFPIIDYTLGSKVVLCFGIAMGMCTVATFTGIFSCAFVNYLAAERQEEIAMAARRKMRAAGQVIRKVQREWRRRRHQRTRLQGRRAAHGHDAIREGVERTLQAAEKVAEHVLEDAAYARSRLRQPARDILEKEWVCTPGWTCLRFFNAVLLLNVANTVAQTIPQLRTYPPFRLGSSAFEAFSSVVFLVEYILRILAGPPWACLTMWRLFDLACLLPGPLQLVMLFLHKIEPTRRSGSAARCIDFLMLFRIVRVLDFPCFQRSMGLIAKALRSSAACMIVPCFLAAQVWLMTASLFTTFEQIFAGPARVELDTVPASLYYSSSFLIGEWPLIDFSPGAGSWLCVLAALFGIMIFAIPLGIVSEAVQSTLALELVEQAELQHLRDVHKDDVASDSDSSSSDEDDEDNDSDGKEHEHPMMQEPSMSECPVTETLSFKGMKTWKPSKKEVQDLCKKYRLTEDDVKEYRDVFIFFDENKDGIIGASELRTVLHSLGQNPTEAEFQDMFEELDTNGTGMIDFEEFLSVMGHAGDNEDEAEFELLEAFELFDRDGSGLISLEELRYVLTCLGDTLTDSEVRDLLREADADGDGHIDYREFQKMMRDEAPAPQPAL